MKCLFHLSRLPSFPRVALFPSLAALDVRREVNLVGQLADVDLEPVLHLVEGLGVGLVRHEGDSEALGAEAPCPRDPVWGIILHYNYTHHSIGKITKTSFFSLDFGGIWKINAFQSQIF